MDGSNYHLVNFTVKYYIFEMPLCYPEWDRGFGPFTYGLLRIMGPTPF